MKRLFLNFEALPDIEGARSLYGLPATLSDKDTGKVLFHHHVQEQGRDARFLSPWQSRLAMVSMLSMHDEEVKLTSYQMETEDERLLLETVSRYLAEHDMTFCWDEGRGINPLLHVRSMILGVRLPDRHVRTVERRMRIQPGSVSLATIARRFGIRAEAMPGDEPTWQQVLAGGEASLAGRCKANLVASAQLGLKHLYTTGEIDADLHDSLQSSCERL
ncbi:MAG: hypothetical protein P8Z31_08810 [Gammaproteobacteria bacterium]|jgi:hypothetical protein